MKQITILKERMGVISSPDALFENIKKIDVDYSQENLVLFCLNSRKGLIHSEVLFKGGLNSCVVDTKTIFRKALLKNSAAIIVAHNHPSEDLNPSDEDIEFFKNLKNAGEIIDLQVLDSIIFNKKEFYSMQGEDI